MIRRIPVRDVANDGDTYALEGEVTDYLPKDNTVYVTEDGRTFDPNDDVALQQLPGKGVMQIPRTTWYEGTMRGCERAEREGRCASSAR